jgi:hypothetical protein
LDKQEAAHQEAEFLKAKKATISNILVPPSPSDVLPEIVYQTQQFAAIQKTLSMLTGNIANYNNVPSLEEEMTAFNMCNGFFCVKLQ